MTDNQNRASQHRYIESIFDVREFLPMLVPFAGYRVTTILIQRCLMTDL